MDKAAVGFIALFSSSNLWACPVCGFGQDGSAMGFIVTTVLLTALPLLLFGSAVYYLIRRQRKIDNENA